MNNYENLGGNSSIISYENGIDYIKIQFKSGRWTLYTYTNTSAGELKINDMKILAERGEGLNSYIGRQKPKFSSKE